MDEELIGAVVVDNCTEEKKSNPCNADDNKEIKVEEKKTLCYNKRLSFHNF